MPKKGPKNAYFYFMIDFRDDQKKEGIIYANMTEVQQAADPVWRALHPSVRTKYENIAKKEKSRNNISDQKFATSGVSFSEIDNHARLAKEAAENELKDIQHFVRSNAYREKILDEDIYLIDVNSYCETNVGYVIGEVTILRFNISQGIKDHIHQIINPPSIPIGYASDIKRGCEELGLEFPDSDAPRTNFMQLLGLIVDILKQGDPSAKVLPPLYTMPEKVEQVMDFLLQITSIANEDESMFRVYKLDVLFFYVVNTLRNRDNEGLPKESLALAALRKDAFKYTPGIGCEIHESGERTTECSLSRAKRWAYTVLDGSCHIAGVDVVPGRHVPINMDIEAVLSFKEKKKEERCAPAARALSSCNSHDTDFSEAPTHSATNSWAINPSRTLKPLRKPMVDTLNLHNRIVVAPELTEINFPSLNLGSGRGSGRSMQTQKKNPNFG